MAIIDVTASIMAAIFETTVAKISRIEFFFFRCTNIIRPFVDIYLYKISVDVRACNMNLNILVGYKCSNPLNTLR